MRRRFLIGCSRAALKRGLCAATILAWFVSAAFAAEIISPMQAIMDEVRAISGEIGQTPAAEITPELRQRLHNVRQAVLEFTRANTGAALDPEHWARGMESIYATCGLYEWTDYAKADRAVREAWDVLKAAQPQEPGLAYDLAVRMAIWHTQAWQQRNPVECGALLADAEKDLLPYAGGGGKQAWGFFVPNMHREIVRISTALAPEKQAELRAQAEKNLQAIINDETQPFHVRNSHLCRWAMQLYSSGEADRAGRLLDAWEKKHGEKLVFPEFYYARFFAALRGAGGWGVATQTIQRVNRLVYEGKASKDDPFYKLMMKGYYANLSQSDYELQRLAHTNATSSASQATPKKEKP